MLILLACKPVDNPTGQAADPSPPAAKAPADLILSNAYVYTVDEQRTVAEAVALQGEKILFVGSTADAMKLAGDGTEVRDLNGALVLPGFHDMHIHALGTVPPDMCDLDSQPYSLQELVPVLKECISRYNIPPGEFLIVLQWNYTGGNQPTAELPHMRAALDAVSLEHPIFLWGNDGHHGAANSAAFARAKNAQGEVVGMNAATLATDFAEYRPMVAVDEKGEPSGGINETARMLIRPDFFADFLGSSASPESVMPRVAQALASSGITSIQDAWVSPQVLESYDWLEQSGQMTFRLRAALAPPEDNSLGAIDAHLARLKEIRDSHAGSKLIEANAVKLFSDAVLEGNPLSSPPTLPVAAVLNGFKQPIFKGSIEDGSFDIAGYVDQGSELCQSVQAQPEAYMNDEAMQRFVSEQGYYPQQCIPYAGILEHPEEYIRSYIRKATEAGFHVHVHALADQAVRVVVDEFSKVKALADQNGLTQSIAHAQIVHPDDQKRIGELGIASVLTLVWTASGVEYEMTVAPFIDEVKGVADLYNPDHYYMQNVYPAKSIQDAGGPLVHGSDAPVGTRKPIPLASLQMAITRGANDEGQLALNPKE
ncbi:MAG TPA: amidohydrolase family protein, partial [Xanthomonadales bacterium]|nr:amidohydrolase family protein [Xanthomonadales bacterium]